MERFKELDRQEYKDFKEYEKAREKYRDGVYYLQGYIESRLERAKVNEEKEITNVLTEIIKSFNKTAEEGGIKLK